MDSTSDDTVIRPFMVATSPMVLPPNPTLRTAFHALFEEYSEREGQPFTLISTDLEGAELADGGFEPLYKIRFADSVEIDAWFYEIHEEEEARG